MKKILLIAVVTVLVLSITVCAGNTNISDWAKPEVDEAISLGIVPEDMQNNYQDNITRAEFAKVSVMYVANHFNMTVDELVKWYLETRVDGEGKPLTFIEDAFTDIADSDEAYYIKCANTMGIVYGKGEGKFAPDELITREEAATMLLRVYFCYGSGVKLGPKSADVDNFSDAGKISSWADSAVRYMYQWDVMKGVSETRYAPEENYTKEQCYATFLRLHRVYSYR